MMLQCIHILQRSITRVFIGGVQRTGSNHAVNRDFEDINQKLLDSRIANPSYHQLWVFYISSNATAHSLVVSCAKCLLYTSLLDAAAMLVCPPAPIPCIL